MGALENTDKVFIFYNTHRTLKICQDENRISIDKKRIKNQRSPSNDQIYENDAQTGCYSDKCKIK